MNEREIFIEALQRPAPADRLAYLELACGSDAGLRGRVEDLLAAFEKAGSFLQEPDAASVATADHRPGAEPIPPELESPGATIGPYKLRELIGEGGMGVVYVAEQSHPVRRKVALKVIKPGMDTKQVVARFEAERQALAMMDHPNIAKVHDGGTTESGRPYFVMELVPGVPITEYCDGERLSVRQRLELFVLVCRAVQHAHQKGIIHRDLKPSNILVTLHDGVPVPKVIDFGVAKAMGQSLTDKTVYTALSQLVGTPLYMSPEQAEMNQLGVDTRSDVYSLGVLLYELLTGTTPFDKEALGGSGLEEMRRMIREDEPPRPSARVSSLQPEALSTTSQRRSTDPRRISAALHGELDWIVMKSLEKDRGRRYESASAFATDVQRYLDDEPVLAGPPSTMYKFHKFARKHRAALATAVAIAASLILGTTASAWQAVRATTAEAQANANATQAQEKAQEATTQRDEAQKQRDEVRALNDQLQRTLYASDMNLAQHAWEAGGVAQVRDLLERHVPKAGEADLRDFEWHYLNRLCHAELLTLQHSDAANCVAFSPDGKRLASGSERPGRTVKVWDAQTGRELLHFTAYTDGLGIRSLTFSPDGKRLATAFEGPRNPVKVWDAQTGQELLSLRGFRCVVFSPDGKRLATGGGGGGVWDAQTGQKLFSLLEFAGSLAFSPDGKRLAGGGSDGKVNVWDAQTGEKLHSLKGHSDEIRSIAFSPDGTRLASASEDYTAKVWNAQSGQELLSLEQAAGGVIRVAFSPDGKRLAGACFDQAVKVWDAQTGEELLVFKGHSDEVLGVAFSPDGQRLTSASADATVKVWDAQAVQKPLPLQGGATSVWGWAPEIAFSFSPDCQRLAGAKRSDGYNLRLMSAVKDAGDIPREGKDLIIVAEVDRELHFRIFDSGGKEVVDTNEKRLTQQARPIEDLRKKLEGLWPAQRLSRSQQTEVIDAVTSIVGHTRSDKSVKVWDTRTGQELLSLNAPVSWSPAVAFSLDGKRLAAEANDKTVKVWDAQTGQELLSLQGYDRVAFSPDGKRLASGGTDKTVKVWDAVTGQELLSLKGLSGWLDEGSLAFSPDGTRLAGAAWAELKVWDAQTGQELLSLQGHTSEVKSMAFSPDGKSLATASRDRTVKVWNAQSGQLLLSLKGHTNDVGSVAYSPNGKRLVSASRDKTVKVWDAQTGQELLSLKGHSGWPVASVAFSPDGQRLASAWHDSTVMIYDATPLPEK